MDPGSPQPGAQERIPRIARGDHSGYSSEASLQFAVQGLDSVLVITCQSGIDSEEEDVVRIEPRIDVPEVSKRAYEQASTGEHDYGKRNLSNN